MNKLIRSLRLFIFGPRSVESALKSFNKTAQDLRDSAEVHTRHASVKHSIATAYRIEAAEHASTAAHAERVAVRIEAFTK